MIIVVCTKVGARDSTASKNKLDNQHFQAIPEKLHCRLKDKLALHWKAPVLSTPGAFPLLLLLLLLLSCLQTAARPWLLLLLLPWPCHHPPVPLGKKTQRFRELLQNLPTHTFEQCTQHWDSSTGIQGIDIVSGGDFDTFRDSRHMCKQPNPCLGHNSVALNVLKAVLRIIYDKARKHPDFLLRREIIEKLTFLKFHSWRNVLNRVAENTFGFHISAKKRWHER